MSECNLKDVFCLNKKKGADKLTNNVLKVMKGTKIGDDLYSFSIQRDGKLEEHRFILDLKKSKKDNSLSMKIFDETKNEYEVCMDLKFTNYDLTKESKGEVVFKKSKIKLIAANKCSLNEKKEYTKKMSGTFVLKLADKLNVLLGVKTSELDDDSKLILCDDSKRVSLKIAFLLRTGKTWYEKAAGYKLKDPELYDYVTKAQTLTVKEIIDYLTNKENKLLGEFLLKEDKIVEITELLSKLGLDANATMKQVTTEMFKKDSGLTECEKFDLWSKLFRLPKRKEIKDDKIKAFYELMGHELEFTKSVKTY